MIPVVRFSGQLKENNMSVVVIESEKETLGRFSSPPSFYTVCKEGMIGTAASCNRGLNIPVPNTITFSQNIKEFTIRFIYGDIKNALLITRVFFSNHEYKKCV